MQAAENWTPDFVWARRRSRLGLILGPGALVLALLVTLARNVLFPAQRYDMRASMVDAALLLALLHLASFIEFAETVRVLRRRPFPTPVLVLTIYWGLLLCAAVVVAVVAAS